MFSAATLNCASVRPRLDPIVGWLGRHPVDVLGLQETKVEDDAFPVMDFRMAGDETARLIWAVVRGVTVVDTYGPQGQVADSAEFAYKLEWLDHLPAFFTRHWSPREPLLWVGDFNVALEPIDVHAPEMLGNHSDFHPAVRAALERIRAWGSTDVFRQFHPEPGHYTYWDYRTRGSLEHNRGWRIDHIWATRLLAVRATAAWIDVDARRAPRPSDHTLLVAVFGD